MAEPTRCAACKRPIEYRQLDHLSTKPWHWAPTYANAPTHCPAKSSSYCAPVGDTAYRTPNT